MEQMEQKTQAPSKYAELLAQSKDQRDAQEQSIQVEEAAQDLESAITNQKRGILQVTRKVQDAKTKFPLDLKSIIEAQTELRDLQRGMEDLTALKAELF
jgi:hypothetical protein